MIFSHFARILSIAALLIGLYEVLLGLAIATGILAPYEAALARYTSAKSAGQVIDTGVYVIFGAVVLGTLAEMSFSMRKRSGENSN